MALFTDNNKYAAEIIVVHPEKKYSVRFYDGFVRKNLPESSLDKFSESAAREAELLADNLYGSNVPKTADELFDRYERRRCNSKYRTGNDS